MEKIGYEIGYKMWQKRCQTEKKTKTLQSFNGKESYKANLKPQCLENLRKL